MSQTTSYLLKTLQGSEHKFGFMFSISLHTLPLCTSKGLMFIGSQFSAEYLGEIHPCALSADL